MTITNTKPWDASEHLDSEEMIFAYMNAALEDGDPSLVTAAIGDIARARGMSAIARQAGVSRESLYKALSAEGNPEFSTVLSVLKAMNIKIAVAPADDGEHGESVCKKRYPRGRRSRRSDSRRHAAKEAA